MRHIAIIAAMLVGTVAAVCSCRRSEPGQTAGGPWPPEQQRAAWHAEVRLGAAQMGLARSERSLAEAPLLQRHFAEEDVSMWRDRLKAAEASFAAFMETEHKGRSEELAKRIMNSVDSVTDDAARQRDWSVVEKARETQDAGKLWAALARYAERHRVETSTDVEFWKLHARLAGLSRDYKLLQWAAGNVLLFDPTAGEFFVLRLCALGDGEFDKDQLWKEVDQYRKQLTAQETIKFLESIEASITEILGRRR